MSFEIKDIHSAVIYRSEAALNTKEALLEAVKANSNLSGANLSGRWDH
jgi:hypothetical protein